MPRTSLLRVTVREPPPLMGVSGARLHAPLQRTVLGSSSPGNTTLLSPYVLDTYYNICLPQSPASLCSQVQPPYVPVWRVVTSRPGL